VHWPQQGNISAKVQKVRLVEFADWIGLRRTTSKLASSIGLVSGSNSPINFEAALAGHAHFGDNMDLAAQGKVKANAAGLHVLAWSITNQNQRVATVSGSLPFVLDPGRTNGLIQAEPRAVLQLDAEVDPEALSGYLKTSGVSLQGLELTAHFGGQRSRRREAGCKGPPASSNLPIPIGFCRL